MDTQHTKTMFVRTMYIMVILMVALSVTAFSLVPTQRSESAARLWLAAFTYDVPAGTWSEGQHTYYFEWEWSGGSDRSNDAPLYISSEAPLYRGFVLLRPLIFGIQARARDECIVIDAVNPNQPTRFLAGWVTDIEMTYPEARAFFDSLTSRVVWDNGISATLVQHEIRPYFAELWPGYVCTYTAPR